MNEGLTPLAAGGRILLALLFVLTGMAKLNGIDATAASMANHGIPYAQDLVWGAVVLELGGGLMLMAGLLARAVALVFFFYLLTLAVIFHPYWLLSGAAAHAQHTAFFEHLCMMGGMLYVVAFGAGPLSVDGAIRSRTRLAPAQ